MAVGVDIDMTGQPWIITYNGANGTPLPAIVVGVQATGNQAYPLHPKRIVWIAGDLAAATNKVILKDVPGVGGGGTPRIVAEFTATGADYMPPQEWKASDTEAWWVGLQVTTFDSGTLFLYM